MTTTLYLRETISDINPGSDDERQARLERGAAATSHVTNTALGPATLQLTAAAAGTVMAWFTPPLVAVTISGTITPNLRMLESALTANAGARIVIERVDVNGTFVSTVCASSFGTELTAAEAAQSWAITPTSTTLADGDRLRIRVYAADAGGTMAASQTVTIFDDGPTAAASGDSYVTFTETVAYYQVGIISDTFTRTTASTWGSNWTQNGGTAANYSTTGTEGQIVQTAVSTSEHAVRADFNAQDGELVVQIKSDKVPVGASATASFGLRFLSHQNYYRLLLTITTAGAVSLAGEKIVATVVTNVVTSANVARETWVAATYYTVRFRITGNGAEQWYGRIWRSSTSEPATWDLTGTRASGGEFATGMASLRTFLSGTVSNIPITFNYDNFSAATVATMPYSRIVLQAMNRAATR